MGREWQFYVYILASRSKNLYTGITNDLWARVKQHKEGTDEGFTKKYKINRLVYFERFRYVRSAIAREKQIKSWRREKRVALIETANSAWQDLAENWYRNRTDEEARAEFARMNSAKMRFTKELQIPQPQKRRLRDDKS